MSAADFTQSRVAMLTAFRAGLALRRPEAFMCITGLDGGPSGPPRRPTHLELLVGERLLRIPLGARDELGYPAALVRQYAPSAGYTRDTLGDHEAARDTRRRRRPWRA